MPFVRYEEYGEHIRIITLNRPERLNAWGSQMAQEMEEAFARFADDPKGRVAILRGEGRAFCAGVDVKEWAERGEAPAFGGHYRRVFTSEWGTPALTKPVIGAVHGYCLGAGLNLVLMRCDIRIAAEGTKFGLPEVARGIMTLSTPFGYQNIPTCFLAELCFTAQMVDAQRALQFGMINMVVPLERLVPTALEMAQRIALHAPRAVQMTKENLLQVMAPSARAFLRERTLREQSFASPDAYEGMRAWVEKRAPRWQSS
ncbi:MAG: enoyl-CoA hydratase/isomerase family protein [Dehalococcoidia bacterium]|nr:enoyl-CoA hydratase/isomerase family protein [Dehalococcoidia bacterium]MDW8120287.1 enoyl-CoA hydratase/isomerase family protein [Chloroflexota bacterium]